MNVIDEGNGTTALVWRLASSHRSPLPCIGVDCERFGIKTRFTWCEMDEYCDNSTSAGQSGSLEEGHAGYQKVGWCLLTVCEAFWPSMSPRCSRFPSPAGHGNEKLIPTDTGMTSGRAMRLSTGNATLILPLPARSLKATCYLPSSADRPLSIPIVLR